MNSDTGCRPMVSPGSSLERHQGNTLKQVEDRSSNKRATAIPVSVAALQETKLFGEAVYRVGEALCWQLVDQ